MKTFYLALVPRYPRDLTRRACFQYLHACLHHPPIHTYLGTTTTQRPSRAPPNPQTLQLDHPSPSLLPVRLLPLHCDDYSARTSFYFRSAALPSPTAPRPRPRPRLRLRLRQRQRQRQRQPSPAFKPSPSKGPRTSSQSALPAASLCPSVPLSITTPIHPPPPVASPPSRSCLVLLPPATTSTTCYLDRRHPQKRPIAPTALSSRSRPQLRRRQSRTHLRGPGPDRLPKGATVQLPPSLSSTVPSLPPLRFLPLAPGSGSSRTV